MTLIDLNEHEAPFLSVSPPLTTARVSRRQNTRAQIQRLRLGRSARRLRLSPSRRALELGLPALLLLEHGDALQRAGVAVVGVRATFEQSL